MKAPISNPMSFWREQDILHYLQHYNLPLAKCYGEIIPHQDKDELTLSGCLRTGCMFCMFGCHLEKAPNRFQKMKLSHPKQYEYCIKPVEHGGLGLGDVLDFLGVDYA
jgi:3'-phosphoadenosine 5'-phosphosulfate sulfotransferase (PAPS reductase)/FAD synthetase